MPLTVNVVSNVRPLLFASLVALASIALPAIARADCSTAPLGNADDMVISFLAGQGGTQAAPSTQFTSAVKEGMLVYDDTTNAIRYCDGTNWVSLVGSGGGGSATAAGSGSEVQFRNSGTGAFAADANFVWDDTNDRLGIGTASPNQILSVSGTTGGELARFDAGASGNSHVSVTAGTGRLVLAALRDSGGAVGSFDNSKFSLRTNNTDRVWIDTNGNVGIATATPAASALLDLTSTTKGFLPPRMTEAQRDAIASPATGLVVYNTDDNALNYWDGDSWEAVGTGAGGGGSGIKAAAFGYRGGTIQILESNGISSIVRNSAGKYTVNFTTPFPNDDYIVVGSCNAVNTSGAMFSLEGGSSGDTQTSSVAKLTTSVSIGCRIPSTNSNTDVQTIHVAAYEVTGSGGGGGGGSSQWADVTGGLSYASGGAAVGTGTLNASAILQADSTTKGFLPPRMTTAQRDAIASPAEGLVVYNTSTKSLDLRVASSWLSFGGSMTGNTMVPGWPDAIICTDNGGTPGPTGRVVIFWFDIREPGPGNVSYSWIGSGPSYWGYSFTSAGAYNSKYINPAGPTDTTDCEGKSIATLYAEGKAFNLAGGSTASADGTSGQVQFNEGGNLKADAALHWDNANKRLGIGTASPASKLEIAGQDGLAITGYEPFITLRDTNASSLRALVQGKAGDLYLVPNSFIGGTPPVVIKTSTGNVGIGTAGPSAKLHVSSSGPDSILLDANTGGSTPWVASYLHLNGNIDYRGRGMLLTTAAAEAGASWFVGVPYTGGGFQIGNSNAHNVVTANNPSVTTQAKLFIASSGNVGIGTASPGYTLHVNGTAYATGAAGALSDVRHKKDVKSLKDGALELIGKLRPVSFQWKDPRDDGMKGEQFGFIAQEVEKILPQIVLTQNDEDKTKGLKPTELIPVLTKAIQELKADNDNLRKALKAANDNDAAQDAALEELRGEIQRLKAAR